MATGYTMDAVRDMPYRDLAAIRRVLDRVMEARKQPDAAPKPPATTRVVRPPTRRPPQRPRRPHRRR